MCEIESFQVKQKTALKIHFALNDRFFSLYSLVFSLSFQAKV